MLEKMVWAYCYKHQALMINGVPCVECFDEHEKKKKMTKKTNHNLKPCPFCGSKQVRFITDEYKWSKGVECRKCGMNIYFFRDGWNVASFAEGENEKNKSAIAERWNSRKL
jgi:Lar family restriction alleviation protein